MKQKFNGGFVYENYDRATRSFTNLMRKITVPIELEVTLLDSWPVNGGVNKAWSLALGDGLADVYIASGSRTGEGEEQGNQADKGGLLTGDGWNLDFDCLNQEEPILERIKCFIKKAWKLILVIVGLLLLLRKRKKS